MWLRATVLVTAALLLPPAWAEEDDARIAALSRFFTEKQNPQLAALAAEFIAAADRHALDWRLLPALAVVETASGRLARGNNLFGWGRRRFASFSESIAYVAEQLSEAPHYRGKSTREKLVAYNPRYARRFPVRVEKVMAGIGPAPDPAIH